MPALICGSLAFDTITTFPGRFAEQILPEQLHILNVSFLVPQLRREFGGCAGNIAYSLHQLGGVPLPMATVGSDGAGYAQRLQQMGISTEFIRELSDSYTAQAMIMTDQDNNQITAFHPGAMSWAHQTPVQARPDIKLAIISPDGRDAMLEHAQQLHAAGIPFVFDPGQGLPMFNGDELAQFVKMATWVTVNGNHNWVEVWLGVDGAPKHDSEVTPMLSLQWQAGWRVTEYNPDAKGWDHAWFMERAAAADPAKQETWIYASSWTRTGLTFPMVWNLRSTQVHGIDRTAASHALNGGRKVPVAPDKTHIALRAYRGDKRVAAEVTVTQGSTSQAATTKGEDKDLNDVTRVEVPAAGGKVTVKCGEVTRTITPEAGKELTIELRLP
jgi:sugar/nucleoside kinase (ribokinase family)